MRRTFLIVIGVGIGVAAGVPSLAQPMDAAVAAAIPATIVVPGPDAQEQFLRDAPVVKVRGVGKGITGTQRATLSGGGRTHDASVQTIDQSASRFESSQRVEFNFRDYWGYNVAAYRLARLLGLDMIPPSIDRPFRGERAAFTWWIDEVAMDEGERMKTRRMPPDALAWNRQIYAMRVFDELVANTDRNAGNMLIDTRWRLWLIDHTRAFRTSTQLTAPHRLVRCERVLLARMRTLTGPALEAAMGEFLTPHEIRALLARRDRIVARIDALGPDALYDLPRFGS